MLHHYYYVISRTFYSWLYFIITSKNIYLIKMTEYKELRKKFGKIKLLSPIYRSLYEILEKYFAFIVAYGVRDRYCVVIFQ